MATIDFSKIVAIISPRSVATTDAFLLEHNENILLLATETDTHDVTAGDGTRDVTPAVDSPPYLLGLTLSRQPFDPVMGYCFGSDPECCDVLLAKQLRANGISGKHFTIDYTDEGQLQIRNKSRHGIRISSTNTHLLVNETMIIESEMMIEVGYLAMCISIPDRDEFEDAAFRKEQNLYIEARRAAIPVLPFQGMNFTTGSTTLPAMNLLTLKEKIGQGAFAGVYRALDKRGRSYAVKIFNTKEKSMEEKKTVCSKEISILRAIRHVNIISIIDDSIVDEVMPYLVLEYLELGNLDQFRELSLEETEIAFQGILSALEFAHTRQFAHRDVKPENVLVACDRPFSVKLADFGLSGHENFTTFCGTNAYCAPEVYKSRADPNEYTTAIDIWSVGIMMLECARGLLPKKPSQWSVHTWIGLVLTSLEETPKTEEFVGVLEMASKLLRVGPKDRPTAQDCLQMLELGFSKNRKRHNDVDTKATSTKRTDTRINLPFKKFVTYLDGDIHRQPNFLLNLTGLAAATDIGADKVRSWLDQKTSKKHIIDGHIYVSIYDATVFFLDQGVLEVVEHLNSDEFSSLMGNYRTSLNVASNIDDMPSRVFAPTHNHVSTIIRNVRGSNLFGR